MLTKTNFVIQEFIKEVFESLSIKAENQQIGFSIKKGCESPLTVFADKEKIRQVLINLLDNSIKYSKHGGHIVASMYKVDEKHILVEISDDGIGIPEKHLQRIFERFYRTEGGRSRDITGSGLGSCYLQTYHRSSRTNYTCTKYRRCWDHDRVYPGSEKRLEIETNNK